MKVTFQIHYRTVWGEELKVVFPHRNISLHTNDGYLWSGDTEFSDCDHPIPYYYSVFTNGKCTRTEWHIQPHYFYSLKQQDCRLYDDWRDIPLDAYFYSAAFTEEQGKTTPLPSTSDADRMLVFRATCPVLPSAKYQIKVTGNQDILGQWNPQQAVNMYQIAPHEWIGMIPAACLSIPFEYKFIAVSSQAEEAPLWELENNRQWQCLPNEESSLLLPESEIHFDCSRLRLAGTAIPVFSLRSKHSFGVGDFGDLRRFIDWALLTHQKVIQILPVNDSTCTHQWTDSYPYKGISVYALHPMYMDLNQLGHLSDPHEQIRFDQLQKELNALPDMDYERVNNAKWEYIQLKYKEDGKQTFQTDAFQTFFKQNEDWLRPYAAYSYLRDKYHTPDFTHWGKYSIYNRKNIEKLCMPGSPDYENIAFFYYMQFHLHLQLLAAGEYARTKGVILKGDIPIGVGRYSVETWIEPHYFNLNGQAGAPPDPFSANGQNWGFPTYDWERMAQDDYRWWRRRFSKMAEYFTAYRIDHILGFFRIWEIPSHAVHGLLGQFSPALPLTAQEIESFGFPFCEEIHTHPYIDDELLERIFGDDARTVKQHFVYPTVRGRYEIIPELATQKQVEEHFKGLNDARSIRLRNGLYNLISEVLFVPDHRQPGRYHPRILAQNSYFYSQLDRYKKGAFTRLHQHYFYERHNDFWFQEAMKKLPALTQCTSMLACGEDLGMIPACVPGVMEQLRILSLEIERMPKKQGYLFDEPEHYPYSSVCTFSTHDMSTLRGWWNESPNLTERYWQHVLGHHSPTPDKADGNTCTAILNHQLASPSMLCILSWQDWLSIDEQLRCPDIDRERINVPANPLNYWHYRMHLTIEELMQADALNARIRHLIDESGRHR